MDDWLVEDPLSIIRIEHMFQMSRLRSLARHNRLLVHELRWARRRRRMLSTFQPIREVFFT